MRLLSIVVGILGLVNTSSAQSVGYGSVKSDPGTMTCDLNRTITPSKEAAELLKGQGATYACVHAGIRYDVSFVGVDFNAAKEAGSAMKLAVRCSTSQPTGIYVFGGYPVGFRTSSFQDSPWFYNPNSNAPGGRCFVIGDAILMKQMKAVKNKSAMVVLPKTQLQ